MSSEPDAWPATFLVYERYPRNLKNSADGYH